MHKQPYAISRTLQHTQKMLALLVLGLFLLASNQSHAGGTWTKKSVAIDGGWSIVEKNGSQVLMLDENFSTNSGPDLKIFLSRQSISSLTGKNAINDAILVSPLQSNRGAQEYVLPANIDLSQFQSVIIHCESFSKLWGGSSL